MIQQYLFFSDSWMQWMAVAGWPVAVGFLVLISLTAVWLISMLGVACMRLLHFNRNKSHSSKGITDA